MRGEREQLSLLLEPKKKSQLMSYNCLIIISCEFSLMLNSTPLLVYGTEFHHHALLYSLDEITGSVAHETSRLHPWLLWIPCRAHVVKTFQDSFHYSSLACLLHATDGRLSSFFPTLHFIPQTLHELISSREIQSNSSYEYNKFWK